MSDGAAVPGPNPRAAVVSGRWLGLDALRGLTIAAMILVNNPGSWGPGYQYPPLAHAAWHGCTFTDLVFPTFLFCAGVAIVPALTKKLQNGTPRGPLAAGVGRRVLVLVLLGMGMSAFPFLGFEGGLNISPLLHVRFPGVLQRIGVCYGIAALLFLFTAPRTQRLVLLACLVVYWPLLACCPSPDGGAPDLDSRSDHLAGWLDRTVFGAHVWRETRGQYDPEGLLSTIPAVATALFGVAAGRVLRSGDDLAAKVATLLRRGTLLMAAGAVWGWFLPMNKALWTSSYAVWTAGIATVGLGLSVWAFEQRRWAALARPLQVYGQNALLVFVGSGLLGRIVGSLIHVPAAGQSVSLQQWFFRTVLLPIGDPRFASLAFALLWVAGWYVVLAALFRRGIVWKV
ncbi:MAG TPA: heparan-alpha-glucosaminide N-acetyltransferase domain-containing protein [Planctomycetota bacterium]|nr:heparan-alpha-glucosaminide N-acetyltransferase domain-containing protein [Planctomycetota bacterium]